MAENSKIEWTDHTFNPWVGCTRGSPACDHCYAETWAKRTGNSHLWEGERRRTTASNWHQPIRWNRQAAASGIRYRVFCASLADVFDNQVPTRWRDDLWHRIEQTPQLDWLLLTKRPQNIRKMLPSVEAGHQPWGDGWPNVWLGTTAENQEEAERRIPHLLAAPAAVRFLSCEPLLGPIDFGNIPYPSPPEDRGRRGSVLDGHEVAGMVGNCIGWVPPLDWIIVGGESGPGARPMMIQWARSIRDQCAAAGVAFHFKQWGEHAPDDPSANRTSMVRVGKKVAGRLLDGVEHNGLPDAAPAPCDRHPTGRDRADGLGAEHEGAVREAEAPVPSSPVPIQSADEVSR